MTTAFDANKVQSAPALSEGSGANRASSWRIGLWSAQIALALLFGASGGMKVFMSPEAQAAMGMNDALDIPVLLLRFIGVCEIAGAFGMILPALTGSCRASRRSRRSDLRRFRSWLSGTISRGANLP